MNCVLFGQELEQSTEMVKLDDCKENILLDAEPIYQVVGNLTS